METDAFKEGIKEPEKIALAQRTAYMCSAILQILSQMFNFAFKANTEIIETIH